MERSLSPIPIDISTDVWLGAQDGYRPSERARPLNDPVPSQCLCRVCHDDNDNVTPSSRVVVTDDVSSSSTAAATEVCRRHRITCGARIGSDSSHAQVFRVDIHTHHQGGVETRPAAFKVMPITSQASEIANQREIDVARRASRLVETGQSPHFPLVYGSHSGCRVRYAQASPWARSSRDYQVKMAMSEALPHDEARRQFWNQPFRPLPALARSFSSAHPEFDADLWLNRRDAWRADVLMSELAFGDLWQWTATVGRHGLSENVWSMVVELGLDAISDLQDLLGVYHKDLHWGNVLVVLLDDGRFQLLIHDFGKSVVPGDGGAGDSDSSWTSEMRVQDAKTFLEGFDTVVAPKFPALADDIRHVLAWLADEARRTGDTSSRMPALVQRWALARDARMRRGGQFRVISSND